MTPQSYASVMNARYDDLTRRAISSTAGAVTGTTYATGTARPMISASILADIEAAFAAMPPRETWVSSKFFPVERAIVMAARGENLTLAHPDYWKAIRYHAERHGLVKSLLIPFDFDLSPRTKERDRIVEQMYCAMGPKK